MKFAVFTKGKDGFLYPKIGLCKVPKMMEDMNKKGFNKKLIESYLTEMYSLDFKEKHKLLFSLD